MKVGQAATISGLGRNLRLGRGIPEQRSGISCSALVQPRSALWALPVLDALKAAVDVDHCSQATELLQGFQLRICASQPAWEFIAMTVPESSDFG